MEHVRTSINFLGCVLSYVGETDVDKKFEKLKHIFGAIRRTLNGKFRRDTLYKFNKVLALPCGLYGSETWTLNTKTRGRIQAGEIQFLRPVL